jgi:hypothetical protein
MRHKRLLLLTGAYCDCSFARSPWVSIANGKPALFASKLAPASTVHMEIDRNMESIPPTEIYPTDRNAFL